MATITKHYWPNNCGALHLNLAQRKTEKKVVDCTVNSIGKKTQPMEQQCFENWNP